MKTWEKTIIAPNATIEDAITVLTETGLQICLVCDHQKKLLGTVTDGDIRRGIIRSLPLSTRVNEIMNDDPHVGDNMAGERKLRSLNAKFRIRVMPIVDSEGIVTDLLDLTKIGRLDQSYHNPVVIMAGGLGKRLRPVTNSIPKPLIPVGNRPLLETIIEGFKHAGFYDIYISVNYKSEMIKNHFQNGETWGVQITYIEEDEPMGTAGALRLFPNQPKHPMIVMNGDLLTSVDFHALLDYHYQQRSSATMCVRNYDIQIPFGVIHMEEQQIINIVEKPIHQYLVNAGIYVLEPELLAKLPGTGIYDMTQLFQELIAAKERTAVFPIREYWLDIGRMKDLDEANWIFKQEFSR